MERVHMAELDPDVIAVAKRHFGRVHRGAFDDARLQVTVGDGLAYLRATAQRYDFVAMDLTDPVGPSAELYSSATFALARGAMAEGGALVLHLGSPFSHPQRLRETLASLRRVFRVVAPYFVYIPLYGSLWGFACASDTLDPRALDPAEVDRRIAARGVGDLQYYNGEVHRAMFALPNYVRALVS
jgi:spermidine synthase